MSLLTGYSCDGTPGGTVTTGNSGFTLLGGTTPLYNAAGDGIEVLDGGATTASYVEDQTTGEWEAFVFSIAATPVSVDNTIAYALNGATGLAALRVRTSGFIAIFSGLGTLVATGTTTIAAGTRYRIERQVNASGQRCLLYTETGSTALDDLSGAVASALACNKRRWGHPQTAQASGTTDIYSAGVYDAQPNLGVAPAMVFVKAVNVG